MVLDALMSVINMPFFVVILILCAYFMWSKFLNKNKLKINDVNDILDVLSIFLFLLFSIGGFVILGLMFIGIINLNFDLPGIVKALPFLIGGLGIILAISFVTGFRHKKGGIKDMEEPFKKTISYFLIFAIFLGSFYIFHLFTPIRIFIEDSLIIALLVIMVVLPFCWHIFTNTLFGEKSEKMVDKKSIPLLIGIFILGLILSGLVSPLVNHHDIEHQRILIYDVDRGSLQKSYFVSEANISFISSGIITSIPSFVALDYSQYDFIFNKTSIGNRFEITAISNETKRYTVLDSYSDIEDNGFEYSEIVGIKGFNLKDGLIAIKFDKKEFDKNKIDYFKLKGLIETNISKQDFSYRDNTGYSQVCSENRCEIQISINNSLNIPVDLNDDTLVNLNNRAVEDVKKCKFTQVFTEYNFIDGVYRSEWFDCSKNNDCSFDIRGDLENKSYEAFRMHLSNNGEGVISRSYTKIEEPIEIKLNIFLDC